MQERRLGELEEQAKRVTSAADPLALIKLLPDKLLGRVIEAQLPSQEDDDLNALVRQIEPITKLLANIRPQGQNQPAQITDQAPQAPGVAAPQKMSG
jgi:hypothetical protein